MWLSDYAQRFNNSDCGRAALLGYGDVVHVSGWCAGIPVGVASQICWKISDNENPLHLSTPKPKGGAVHPAPLI